MSEKTTVMRIIEAKKVQYIPHYYPSDKAYSATEVADFLKENPLKVFKTLIVVGKSRNYYACLVPSNGELDLKKVAKHFDEKSIEMIHQKELLPLTGYVHGGCSPIGLKKRFDVVIDTSALIYDTIIFSGGKIGTQVEINPHELSKIIEYSTDDIVMK